MSLAAISAICSYFSMVKTMPPPPPPPKKRVREEERQEEHGKKRGREAERQEEQSRPEGWGLDTDVVLVHELSFTLKAP